MLTVVKNQIKISFLSTKYALKKEMLNKVSFFSNIIFMILNNASFIIQWVVLFSVKDNIGGYSLKEVLLLWGLAASTFGISRFFFRKAFGLSEIINYGKLDSFLVQPKNVLISIITSEVEVSAIGDTLYGLIMLFIYGINLKVFLLFIFFSLTGALILTSITIIFNSLSFWFSKSDLLSEKMDSFMTNFATYPDGIFKGIVKIILYTIVPVGIANYLPVKMMINFDLKITLLIVAVTIILIAFSFIIFNRGLKRYSSSNLMSARI